jgi:predicted secreted protein
MIQPILSAMAVYFVVWWITLFAILPIGMRTQEEDGHITLGTVASAPVKFRPLRVVVLTTLVSGIIYGSWYICSTYFGLSLDAIPQIVPRYE